MGVFQLLLDTLLGSGAFGCVYRAVAYGLHGSEMAVVAVKMTRGKLPLCFQYLYTFLARHFIFYSELDLNQDC